MTLQEVLVLADLASPSTAARVGDALESAAKRYSISTPMRTAAWLAQCSHESCGFSRTVENLNYSTQGLLKVFPKYFTAEQAKEYARQPERIANRVYGGRLGNIHDGDGWRYRGRGFIQVTGLANYIRFRSVTKEDVVGDPDRLAEPDLAALSAAWFWDDAGCNALADHGYFVDITRRINGGLNGLVSRQQLYAAAKKVLGL